MPSSISSTSIKSYNNRTKDKDKEKISTRICNRPVFTKTNSMLHSYISWNYKNYLILAKNPYLNQMLEQMKSHKFKDKKIISSNNSKRWDVPTLIFLHRIDNSNSNRCILMNNYKEYHSNPSNRWEIYSNPTSLYNSSKTNYSKLRYTSNKCKKTSKKWM